MVLDLYGRNLDELKKKKLFLLDQDGTLYNGSKLFPATIPFLQRIHDLGATYVFITNNSSLSVDSYIQRMANFKIKTSSEDFFTSTEATVIYLNEHYPQQTVYAVGTKSFCQELIDQGITLSGIEKAEVALLAYDSELTYAKLTQLCELLSKRDIPYLATNPDWVCPIDFGFVPDCGSMAFMVEKATGKKPYFIGKPRPDMIKLIAEKKGIALTDVVVIGDRLYTDIQSAINAGVTSVLVYSGEATRTDYANYPGKPDYVVNNVGDLLK